MSRPYNAAAWLVDRRLEAGEGERPALLCGAEALSYQQLQVQVWRAQNALCALGVGPQERVAMVVNDGPAFHAWFLGSMRSGAVPVPLSTMLTARELGALLADCEAPLLVLSACYAPHLATLLPLAPALREVVLVGEEPAPPAAIPLHLWAKLDDRAEAQVADTTAASTAFWLYSSGTTGASKGAMHRHQSLEATATTYARQVLRIAPEDRCFSVAKLFFAYGLGNSLTFPLSVGASAVLAPSRPTPALVAELLRAHRPTLFFATPGFIAALLDAEVPEEAFASVRATVTAGEALPGELHRRFTSRYRVPVLDGIGSTEALHIFISNHPGAERPGTSGTPVEGYEVKLLDDAGAEVQTPDTSGYLHVRGPSVTSGYWRRPEATAEALQGEYLRTGDVYTRSADGYWTFLGRNNDMIKVGGIWVSPAEVEGVLVGHPEVLEAAVVGARDQDGLETVVAFVVPKAGCKVDRASLEAHCRAQMAAFKRPRNVVEVESLPRTATGKVQRFALRQRLAEATAPLRLP